MENEYDDIQLMHTCSTCGTPLSPPQKQQRPSYEGYQQQVVPSSGGISGTNILIIVILLILLGGAVYLFKNPSVVRRR